MNCLNDIEDFTINQLHTEIRRRERAAREGKCWYCQMNLEAHTCKHAKPSPVPGWEIKPPRWVSTEDCMGRPENYWQTDGRHSVMNEHVIGIGDTKEEATTKCIKHAKDKQSKWLRELEKDSKEPREMKVIGTPGPGKGPVGFRAMTACDCGCGARARFEFCVGRDIIVIDDPEAIRALITEMREGYVLLWGQEAGSETSEDQTPDD